MRFGAQFLITTQLSSLAAGNTLTWRCTLYTFVSYPHCFSPHAVSQGHNMSHIELNRCLRELAKLFTVFSPFSSFQPFLLYTSMCIPYARHGYTLGLVTVHFSLHVHGELNLPNIIVTKWNSWHVQSLLCWSFVIQQSSTTTKVVTKFSVFCAHPVIVCGIRSVPPC